MAQTAAVLVLEPIFEADLPAEQYAYRRDRGALDAVRQVHRLINSGYGEVVDADLSSYFDSLPHAELLKSVARRVVDGAMLHLIKMWLEAAVRGEADERGNGLLAGGVWPLDLCAAHQLSRRRGRHQHVPGHPHHIANAHLCASLLARRASPPSEGISLHAVASGSRRGRRFPLARPLSTSSSFGRSC